MTAKRRLVPLHEVEEALNFLRAQGVDFSGVDIRADGVTFLPPVSQPGNAYDAYKAKEQSRDRLKHRTQAN